MTPDEIARNYDLLADHWHSDAFPRTNGIQQHERAIAFLKEKRYALDTSTHTSSVTSTYLLEVSFRPVYSVSFRPPGEISCFKV